MIHDDIGWFAIQLTWIFIFVVVSIFAVNLMGHNDFVLASFFVLIHLYIGHYLSKSFLEYGRAFEICYGLFKADESHLPIEKRNKYIVLKDMIGYDLQYIDIFLQRISFFHFVQITLISISKIYETSASQLSIVDWLPHFCEFEVCIFHLDQLSFKVSM